MQPIIDEVIDKQSPCEIFKHQLSLAY